LDGRRLHGKLVKYQLMEELALTMSEAMTVTEMEERFPNF